jgi:hypothetical protein
MRLNEYKNKLLLCLALVLSVTRMGYSTDWAQKAATISLNTTRAQVNVILPIWQQGYIVPVGDLTAESYWVAKDWMVTITYDAAFGVSMTNLTVSPVGVDQVPYPPVSGPTLTLLESFKRSRDFVLQYMVAWELAARHATNALQSAILTEGLTNEDRHVRANAAYVFNALGDERGFDTLQKILTDRSPRPEGQGVPGGNWTLPAQIAADRYYAVHLFGDLKEPRAVPLLVPLLRDNDVKDIVPWSLSQIGGKQAIQALIDTLDDKDPSMRVTAILALGDLHVTEALPRLRELVNDTNRCNFDDLISVGDAARGVIPGLEPNPDAIDRLAASLSSSHGLWVNGIYPLPIDLPSSATIPEVIARVFHDSRFEAGRVSDYKILQNQDVVILYGDNHFTMVLVKTNLGQMIVMIKYSTNGWWYRTYNA